MVQVKICGLTNFEDAQLSIQSGASALGFIFAESPRKVSKEIVRDIITKLESDKTNLTSVFKVGVFVNEDAKKIIKIAEYCKLTHIQLHGDESPEYCEHIPFSIIKAFRVRDGSFVREIKKYQNIFAFLLDAYQKEIRGGTGKQFDYALLKDLPREKVFFLSGGLNPDNIVEAVKMANPDWVDVSSGIESSPGKKDKSKILKLFQNLKSANLI